MVAVQLQAQSLAEFEKLKKEYPNYSAVYKEKKVVIDIFFSENDELKARIKRSEQKLLLKNMPGSVAKESISYSSWEQHLEDLKAVCFIPVGNKYKKKQIDKILTKDELSNSVFYQDISSKNFSYPSTQEGTIYEMEYSLILDNLRFLPVLFTASYIPILDLQIEISYPENVDLTLDFYNLDKESYGIDRAKKGKKITQTISRQQIPELAFFNDAPSISYYCPQVFMRIRSYTIDGVEKPFLRNPKDLHDYYKSWIKDIDNDEDNSLTTLVDSIVADSPTEFEKVKAIYYWVQDNIKYIAFEDGVAGFVPAKPAAVCKSRYGDCKGMAGLTHQMLKIAGIKSHLTWIGSRDLPYTYTQLPTPSVDNHMITTYIKDGEYYFLDATGGNVPIDQTTAFIQGKQALINVGTGFEIKEVPVQPASSNYIHDSTTVSIENGNLKGTGIAIFGGLYRNLFRRRIQSNSPEETRELFKKTLEKGSNKFRLDSIEIIDTNNKDKAITVNYQFTLPDYVKSYGDEVYVNLNLTKVDFEDLFEEDREVPFEIDIASEYKYVTNLQFDTDRYELKSSPEKSSYENELFGFTNEHKAQPGAVIHTFRSKENFLLLEKEQFEDRNDMIKKVRRSFNDSIILTNVSKETAP